MSAKTRKGRSRKITKGASKIDPDNIRKTIYHIDAYRSHIYYNLSFIDRILESGTLGKTFDQSWKKLRRRLRKMAKAATSNPNTLRLARYQSYTETAYQIAVPFLFILLIAGLIAPGIPFIGVIAPYAMIAAFTTMIVGLLGRHIIGYRITKHIDRYFMNNPEAQKLRSIELRAVVQGLIEELRQILISNNEEPEDHLLGIGLTDYDHIEIVKKPRPWRQYYHAKVTYETL